MSRYIVATVTGYGSPQGGPNGRAVEGCSASVLDTHVYNREVKRFRSEDRVIGSGNKRRGIEGAIAAAERHAAALNAEHEAA